MINETLEFINCIRKAIANKEEKIKFEFDLISISLKSKRIKELFIGHLLMLKNIKIYKTDKNLVIEGEIKNNVLNSLSKIEIKRLKGYIWRYDQMSKLNDIAKVVMSNVDEDIEYTDKISKEKENKFKNAKTALRIAQLPTNVRDCSTMKIISIKQNEIHLNNNETKLFAFAIENADSVNVISQYDDNDKTIGFEIVFVFSKRK